MEADDKLEPLLGGQKAAEMQAEKNRDAQQMACQRPPLGMVALLTDQNGNAGPRTAWRQKCPLPLTEGYWGPIDQVMFTFML